MSAARCRALAGLALGVLRNQVAQLRVVDGRVHPLELVVDAVTFALTELQVCTVQHLVRGRHHHHRGEIGAVDLQDAQGLVAEAPQHDRVGHLADPAVAHELGPVVDARGHRRHDGTSGGGHRRRLEQSHQLLVARLPERVPKIVRGRRGEPAAGRDLEDALGARELRRFRLQVDDRHGVAVERHRGSLMEVGGDERVEGLLARSDHAQRQRVPPPPARRDAHGGDVVATEACRSEEVSRPGARRAAGGGQDTRAGRVGAGGGVGRRPHRAHLGRVARRDRGARGQSGRPGRPGRPAGSTARRGPDLPDDRPEAHGVGRSAEDAAGRHRACPGDATGDRDQHEREREHARGLGAMARHRGSPPDATGGWRPSVSRCGALRGARLVGEHRHGAPDPELRRVLQRLDG